MLEGLKAPKGANTRMKRVGRGEGSGLGKTSGRGNKGQKSRTGGRISRGFEGGQMPLHRRLPKRGFNNSRFGLQYNILNVGDLDGKFNPGDTVDVKVLLEKRIIRNVKKDGIKILGNGEINVPLTVKIDRFTKTAKKKIEAAGGKVEGA